MSKRLVSDELEAIFVALNLEAAVQTVAPLAQGTWKLSTSTGAYVLKRKPSSDTLKMERTVLEHLRICGVKAHAILADYESSDGLVYGLYEYVTGDTCIHFVSKSLAEAMGEAISRLHGALKSAPGQNHFRARDLYESTFHSVLPILQSSTIPSILRVADLLEDTKDGMGLLKRLPKQLIHRDAHGGNMVFQVSRFNGFIDFDRVENNVRLFDICYCAMALLPNRTRDDKFLQEWLEVVGGLLRGYHRIAELTLSELRSIWYVVFAIETLFVALFLKSDVEIAKQNAEICLWFAEIRGDVEKLQIQLQQEFYADSLSV